MILHAGPVNAALLYSYPINAANLMLSPSLAYAIAYRESIRGEHGKKWHAANVVSGDGGHGLFQLTSSWCHDWENPLSNARYAHDHFIAPAYAYWTHQNLETDALVRCIAATFNAGLGAAIAGHEQGNVDAFTTDNYADDVWRQYARLVAGEPPV